MTNGTEQQEEVLADGSNKLMTVTKCAHCWSLSPLLKMRDGSMIAILCLLDIIPYTIAGIVQVSNMSINYSNILFIVFKRTYVFTT